MLRVTIWNEFEAEQKHDDVRAMYPEGIHKALATIFEGKTDFKVRTATLDMPEHGLTEEVLNDTDVLIWWSHIAHHLVEDEIAERVKTHVQNGMGFIVLHSSHYAKPFTKLMGTTCSLSWRECNENTRLWVVDPNHPICEGIDKFVDVQYEECYGEYFDIPTPDELVFIQWFKGGNVFRGGCTFKRGFGKIFYFQPGHESYPTYYNEEIRKIIFNAVKWAKPVRRVEKIDSPNVAPEEKDVLDCMYPNGFENGAVHVDVTKDTKWFTRIENK